MEKVQRPEGCIRSTGRDTMAVFGDVEGLSEVIGRAIQEHLERSNINVAWPQIDGLIRPRLRVDAFLEDAGTDDVSSPRSRRVASVSSFPT